MDEVLRFYEQAAEEERLFFGSGLLERERTQRVLARYLPAPPARILDIGGGPGVYAGWLAGLGYEVHLVDPVAKHRNQAARFPLASIRSGDARALPFEDDSADAVLLLGPLYHLTEQAERIQALGEAYRVCRRGAWVAASAISRFASLLHSLVDGFVDDPVFLPILERDLKEGQHRNESGELKYFTTAVFHRPAELEAEVAAGGFHGVEVVGIEGPGWLAKDFDERWQDPIRRERLLRLVEGVEREAPLAGCSLHLLAMGRKP